MPKVPSSKISQSNETNALPRSDFVSAAFGNDEFGGERVRELGLPWISGVGQEPTFDVGTMFIQILPF